MMKSFLYVGLAAAVLAASLFVFAYEYGSPVSRRGLLALEVTESSAGKLRTVAVDGKIGNSSLAVTSIKTFHKDHCIVIVVREGLLRSGRKSGKFHCNIAVTDQVDAIAFGNQHEVIWRK